MIGYVVRHASSRAYLAQVVVDPKTIEVGRSYCPVSIQVNQTVCAIIDVTLVCSGGIRSLNSPAKRIILVVPRWTAWNDYLCQPILFIKSECPRPKIVSLGNHVAVVVIAVRGAGRASQTVERLIGVCGAEMRSR